ncbi:MAG: response regulator [Gemmatimonadota bacterium]|jgi:CheY-like chemotaxis protein|nr:response regulator [Gemmatimonadota bacterium]
MKTVLIVEDQIEFRAIHSHFLQHHGYRVLSEDNGATGVRTAREQKPDLILMDFSIPGLDGVSATEQLKSDSATCDIPVILITAHTYGAVGRRAKEAGCDGFLAKPVDPARVLREVRQHIG